MTSLLAEITHYGPQCYFWLVHRDDSPDPKGLLSSTILRQAIAEANKQVQEVVVTQLSKKWGSYGHFDAKTRAAIGKYSCENRVVAAAKYDSKKCKHPVKESTVSYIKKAYVEEQSRKRRAAEDTSVVSLSAKGEDDHCYSEMTLTTRYRHM